MIYIAADHRGRELQNKVVQILESKNIDHKVVGQEFYSSTDSYVKYATTVAVQVTSNPAAKGILICSSGQGVAIAANRYRGVRAALCWNENITKLARSDDNVNVLCLPALEFTKDKNTDKLSSIINSFIITKFKTSPKYRRRTEQLDRLP